MPAMPPRAIPTNTPVDIGWLTSSSLSPVLALSRKIPLSWAVGVGIRMSSVSAFEEDDCWDTEGGADALTERTKEGDGAADIL